MDLVRTDRTVKPEVKRLPTGSFTVDAHGEVISSTVSQVFPRPWSGTSARELWHVFDGARRAQLPFSELVVQYASYKIVAREMRGGAIIFLSPKPVRMVSSS